MIDSASREQGWRFKGFPSKRGLLQLAGPIRVLHWASSPIRSYTATLEAPRLRGGLR